MVSQDSPSNEEEIVEEITNTIPVLGHHLSHVLMTAQATSHRAPEVRASNDSEYHLDHVLMTAQATSHRAPEVRIVRNILVECNYLHI